MNICLQTSASIHSRVSSNKFAVWLVTRAADWMRRGVMYVRRNVAQYDTYINTYIPKHICTYKTCYIHHTQLTICTYTLAHEYVCMGKVKLSSRLLKCHCCKHSAIWRGRNVRKKCLTSECEASVSCAPSMHFRLWPPSSCQVRSLPEVPLRCRCKPTKRAAASSTTARRPWARPGSGQRMPGGTAISDRVPCRPWKSLDSYHHVATPHTYL